jgi:hypothetical protein
VLLRLAYLTVTNLFGALRSLPMSDRDKDAEILALRHQLTVLERQLGYEPGETRTGGPGVACRSASAAAPSGPTPVTATGTT